MLQSEVGRGEGDGGQAGTICIMERFARVVYEWVVCVIDWAGLGLRLWRSVGVK